VTLRFVKGHGTENDFVLIPDVDGELDLTPSLVVALCDRRAGIGGDGVLRVVRTAAVPEASDQAGESEWFMDYRNADGSVAEMCGNGIRVFARYLAEAGLVDDGKPLVIATRGGTRQVRFEADGLVTVDMGPWETPRLRAQPVVLVGERSWPATGVFMPNPHAVVFVDDLSEAGDLRTAPEVGPPAMFPDGVNVEFVVGRGERHVAMRVHERGVGETRSCGTGACAVMVAAARHAGDGAPTAWTVDVPGGRLSVHERADRHVELTGPAVLVASGEVSAGWAEEHR
jgi:diaminopimelate epimerase